MSAAEEEVYRRRKTSRCENSDTRQRVIGGIGRRKASGTNAIKGRIQQFTLNDALGGDALEDGAFSSDSSRLSSVINSPRVRRSSSNISSRSNSGSIAEIRASRRSRSNSSASSSTGSTSSIAGVSVSTTKTTSSTTTTATSSFKPSAATSTARSATATKSPSITTTPPTPTAAIPTTRSPFIPKSTIASTTKIDSSHVAKTSTSTFPSSTRLASPSKYATSLTTSTTKTRTTPTTTAPKDVSTSNKTSPSVGKDITDNSSNVLNRYGAMNTPGRSRRVSVATTTGKEVSQNNMTTPGIKQQRSESTSSLGQGSLMRSKQMKWENLASENETKHSEEKSRTPSLYRRKISSNDLDLTSASSGSFSSSSSNIKKETTEDTADESLFLRNGTLRGSRRFRTIADEKESSDKKLSVTSSTSPPKSMKSPSPIVARKPSMPKKDENQSKTDTVSSLRKTSNDKVLPPTVPAKKNSPPPVAPKKKISPFHKTSTGIAQLQSQLEKDFDSPVTTSSKTTTQKCSTTSQPSFIDNINSTRKTSKSNFESNSTTTTPSLLQKHLQQQQRKEKNSVPSTTTTTTATTTTMANNDFLANNKNNNTINKNKLRDINNNNDSSSGGSVDLVKKYFGGDDSDNKPDTEPDDKTQNHISSGTSIPASTNSTGIPHKRFGTDKGAKTSTTTSSSGVNKSFDVFKTRDTNERKNVTSRDELKGKEKDGSDVTNETKVALKNTEANKLLDENKKSLGFKNSVVFEENKHSGKSSIIPTNNLRSMKKIIDDCDILQKNTEKTPPQTSLESFSDKKSSDIRIRHDNANYAGTESIANSSYTVEEFVDDQSGLSQQKRQEGDIFSTENSLHRRTRIAYVNEKSRSLLDPSFDVYDNTKHTNGINCDDAVVEKKFVENNSYAKLKTTGHRDRSNTWTTSDSDESIISSDSDQSSSEGKEKTASTLSLLSNSKYEGRRRLTKKRSKRSKTRPKVFMRKVQTACSIDTSDGDILESNYTSDDFSTSRSRDISSAPESTICESDLNENYESLDISLTNKNLNLSTVKDNIGTQSIENNHNNKILVSEATIKNTKIAELKEANRKQKIYDGSMKSSSMTTISKPLQQQNLMSFSSTNMGGSRSEDEGAKLINLHKNKDERIGSVTSISKVRVIQTFNPAPFNPMKKRNGDHQQIHSPSYTEFTSSTNNNSIKPIQASPFSLDIDRKTRLEKLKQGPFPDGEKPFQLTSKSQIQDEESKKAEEILESLPNSPFYMSERLVRDICNTNENIMQSKSTGSLAKSNNHIYIEKDNDTDGDFSPASSPFKLPKSQSFNEAIDLQETNNTEFIAPTEKFKDDDLQPSPSTPKRIMSRPPIDFSSKTFSPIDDIIEDRTFEENPSNVGLRRPSYLRAQDSEENSDEVIPKVPPPPNDADGQDSKVRKRPKRPGLPTISTSTIVTGGDLQKTVGPVEDQRKLFLIFYTLYL